MEWEILLNILNSLLIPLAILSIILSLGSLIEGLRALKFTGIRGKGLPRASIYIVLSITLLVIISMICFLISTGETMYLGLVYLLLLMALVFIFNSIREIKKTVIRLIYG